MREVTPFPPTPPPRAESDMVELTTFALRGEYGYATI